MLQQLGTIFIIFGVVFLVPALVSILLHEQNITPIFAFLSILCFIFGFFIRRAKYRSLDPKSAYALVTLAWLLISLLGSFPFMFVLKLNFLDSLFESMSSFTTTGISILKPSELPKTLIFYRSFAQWLGGVGIIVVFLAVITTPLASKLYMAEARTDRIEPSIVKTAHKILIIYLYFTIISIMALYLSGENLFNSVCNGLATIATGGFSTYNDSYASAKSAVKAVTIFIMIAGAISFAAHSRLLEKDIRGFFNLEVKVMLLVITLLFFVLLRDLNLDDAAFQAVSATTCTGLTTVDLSTLSETSIYAITLTMLIGGCYGSTAGALKIIRAIIVVKAVLWYIKKVTSPPTAVVPFKLFGKAVDERDVLYTLLYIVLYISFALIGAGILTFLGYSTDVALFQSISILGNVGLSLVDEPTAAEKILYIVYMWIGRLEIIPVLILISFIRK